MHENEISKEVVDTAFKIYQKLGPGLLESVYEGIFAYELRALGFEVKTQVIIPVVWKEISLDQGFRADPTHLRNLWRGAYYFRFGYQVRPVGRTTGCDTRLAGGFAHFGT